MTAVVPLPPPPDVPDDDDVPPAAGDRPRPVPAAPTEDRRDPPWAVPVRLASSALRVGPAAYRFASPALRIGPAAAARLAAPAVRAFQPRLTGDHLPPGRYVQLPGRGTTFVCDIPGDEGAPTLVLLHGLVATSYLNWFPTFKALHAQGFRIVAVDHRGHGRGIRTQQWFRLEHCADDVAALADVLEIERMIPVGYSMGGPIAQLLWRRHRDRVEGMVLAATCRTFGASTRERVFYSMLTAAVAGARVATRLPLSGTTRQDEAAAMAVADEVVSLGPTERLALARWGINELRHTSPSAVVQALSATGFFTSRPWIGEVDVPTAVVVTTKDRCIPLDRQMRLADAIEGATVHPIDAGHAACFFGVREFVPALVEACASVADRLPSRDREIDPAA